jgi:hypothetical protein
MRRASARRALPFKAGDMATHIVAGGLSQIVVRWCPYEKILAHCGGVTLPPIARAGARRRLLPRR